MSLVYYVTWEQMNRTRTFFKKNHSTICPDRQITYQRKNSKRLRHRLFSKMLRILFGLNLGASLLAYFPSLGSPSQVMSTSS